MSAPAYILRKLEPQSCLRETEPEFDDVQRDEVYLKSGEVFASAEPTRVTTILGSCVAVCIYDTTAEVGGINHFLLPNSDECSPRFGSHAISRLISDVLARGACRSRLRAKVFGGARVLTAATNRNIGAANVDLALKTLEREKIAVVEYDVGGNTGRRLYFDTDAGTAWVNSL